jgi:Zn-dependent protease with chaperone function
MVTYLYWILIVLVVGSVLYGLGAKAEKWKVALVVSGLVLLVGWTAYYFWLEQMLVKRYGGVMTISVPDGHYHIATTWKDDNLWVENYDPRTNTCIFSEYSKGNLLQGKVTIKNCNPLREK